MASCSLFCTWAQARSGSVPGAKVSSILGAPDASLVADMYNNLSNPVIFCSMICTTLFSTVSAEAPGIEGVDGDGGRRDGRVLGDGQIVDRQSARQHHDDGDDPGEDRAVQKKFDSIRVLRQLLKLPGLRSAVDLRVGSFALQGDDLYGSARSHIHHALDDQVALRPQTG
jgi:hypothetical protein